MRDAKGFTLVELIVAIGVAIGLLTAVYLAINSTQRHSSSIERKVTAQQDVKPALDIMALEIGMASYNPTFTSNFWITPTGTFCGSVTTNQTYRGIQEATANSIAIEMDITNAAGTATDGNGSIDGPNELIRYDYDTANQRLTRATSCGGGGQPFLGDTVAGQKTVRVVNSTLGIPIFRYYDGTGVEIFVGTSSESSKLPTRITDIRRIEIVLAVETENNDVNTGQPRRLIYSTSVIPRNHAIQ